VRAPVVEATIIGSSDTYTLIIEAPIIGTLGVHPPIVEASIVGPSGVRAPIVEAPIVALGRRDGCEDQQGQRHGQYQQDGSAHLVSPRFRLHIHGKDAPPGFVWLM
jgi:hypothetical protein